MKIFLFAILSTSILLSSCDRGPGRKGESKGKLKVDSLSHLEVAEGETVSLKGAGFSTKMKVMVNGLQVDVDLQSSTEASFVMPELEEKELQSIVVQAQTLVVAKFVALDKNRKKTNFSNVSAETICTDNILTQADGTLLRGTRACGSEAKACDADTGIGCLATNDFPAVKKDLIATNVAAGQTLLNIAGTAEIKPADCSADGGTSCFAVAAFPALDKARVLPENIEDGIQIAGISGNLITSAPICSADDETSCLASGGFVAVHKVNTIQANLSKMKDSLSLLGLDGTLEDCSSDGDSACVVTAPTYAAAALSGAQNKILQGQTLAGIGGSVPVRPADCGLDGAINCVAITNFPAVNLSLITANVLKYKSDLSIANVPGTLGNCSTDGQAGCEVVAGTQAAILLSGAEAKIANSEIVGGVTGNAAVRPSDCGLDGGTDCVTIAGFPAVKAAVAPAKILSGQTLANIPGTAAGVRAGDCAGDGDDSCVSVPAFPSMKVQDAAAKIAAGTTVGGVLGTAGVRPPDCGTDGGTACVTITDFPSIDKTALSTNLDKIHSSVSLVGLSGSLITCGSDNALGCLADTNFPAANIISADAKILNGESAIGVTGTAPLRPSDCNAEGGTNCVTVTDFPALDKSLLSTNANKLRSSFTLQSVLGSLNDCSADGTTNCVAATGFPAADKANAAAKILSGQTLANVPGTAGIRPVDCSGDGSALCVTSANYPSINKASITTNADKYRTSLTLGGVQGTLADCSTDNQAGCVALASNPAVIAANVTAGIVKSGTVIAGVTGVYPNASFPLSVSDGLADLDDSTFNAKIKTATEFGWFNRAGVRQSSFGDSNLTAANIKAPVTMFGETGTWQGGTLEAPYLRAGSTTTTEVLLDFDKTCCVATGVLIVRRAGAPVIFTPTNGSDYVVGASLGSDQTVVNKNDGTWIADTGLTPNTIYHYAAWTYDAANDYSAQSTTLYEPLVTTAAFGSINVKGKRWLTKRNNGLDGHPYANGGDAIVMNPNSSYQETALISLDRFGPNMEIEFDYSLSKSGADGFSFSFGKNISDYVTGTLPASGGVGVTAGSGFGVLFTTWTQDRIEMKNLTTVTTLTSVDTTLETAFNTWLHVRIRVTENNVKVFLHNNATATLDYTHGSNFDFTYPYFSLGAGTGFISQQVQLRNITLKSF